MAKLMINKNKKEGTIAPEIYGHFSEHLGRCIYEGLYVGENSEIPNVNGMRTDVVEALKEIKIPVLRWPVMIAEDFSFFEQQMPGVFFFLGTGSGIPLHSDNYDFDDSVLIDAVILFDTLLKGAD